MQYANDSLRPEPRNEDEAAVDRFIDWYGHQIGVEPCLLARPDKSQQGGIDGEYQLNKLRLLIEHTSLDELPNKRTEDAAFQIVMDAFEGVCLPEADCIYSLSLPYGYPQRRDAQRVGGELRAWFEGSAYKYREDKGSPRVKPAAGCPHPLKICVWRSGQGKGRINWSRSASLDIQSRELAKTGLRQRVVACLERKLPKLLNHPAESLSTRILVIQNDEIWRGQKTDYAKFIRGYFHRYFSCVCDEVWSLEIIGNELDCALLWSRYLDKTTGKNPFRDENLSLFELLNIRKWRWQDFYLSQMDNSPYRQASLDLLKKGLDAQGQLEAEDEQQLETLLHLLYEQNVTCSP